MESSSFKYYPRLDHLRFLATFLVLCWHITVFCKIPFDITPEFWPLSFAQEGHTGVALFMTLSGFIFSSLCRGSTVNYKNFIHNRILRIAPLFVFWMFIYFYTSDIDPLKLLASTFGLLNKDLVPGNAWTIIVEFQFYLIFPFLLIFYRSYGLRYLITLIFLAFVIRLIVWCASGSVQYLAYSTIFGRIDQFCLGILFSEIAYKHGRFFSKPTVFIAVLICWAVVFHLFDLSGGFFDKTTVFPKPNSTSAVWLVWSIVEGLFWGIIIASYSNLHLVIPSFLDKTMAWLGTLSYSMYLNQNFSIQFASKIYKNLGLGLLGDAQILTFGVFVLLVLIAFSFLTYSVIEKPFLLLRVNYLTKTPTKTNQ